MAKVTDIIDEKPKPRLFIIGLIFGIIIGLGIMAIASEYYP